ncbi:MAG TPA: efflux RND transporter periplasmic adaptor subunit [Burkholderiales bacterium]|nr:efflux RND transporter periplasmic adaptor subunit [Burkholderiales bacterium]
MHSRSFLVSAVAFVVAACSPSNGSEKKGGPGMGFPPPEVAVSEVKAQSLPLTFEYVGQTAGSREVEVRARVPGIILKRNFAEGEPVKEGQSLYTIDPASFEAVAARAEADVVAAQARHEQAKRNAARMKPLYAEKAVSQKENDDAISAEQITAADLKSAKARLVEAKLNLSYTKVEAPVSGVSSRSLRSEGSLVEGPQTLLTSVMQVDPIWVNFGIPDNEQASLAKEVQAGRVELPKDGAFEVSLRLNDGTVYDKAGKLNFSDVRVSPTTGTREARAEVPNPDGRIRPGEFVRVILKGATRPNAVTVPQRAVLEGPQGKFVYIVDEKGTAQPRPIEVGDWAGDAWIINKGVQPGDKVIVEGLMRLGPGAPVKIADTNAKAPAQGEGPQKPPAKK